MRACDVELADDAAGRLVNAVEQLFAGSGDRRGGEIGRGAEALDQSVAVLLDTDMDLLRRLVELGEQAAGRIIHAPGDVQAGLVDIVRKPGAHPFEVLDIVLDGGVEGLGHAGPAWIPSGAKPRRAC